MVCDGVMVCVVVFSLCCFHCVQFKSIWALRESITVAQRHEGVVYKVVRVARMGGEGK